MLDVVSIECAFLFIIATPIDFSVSQKRCIDFALWISYGGFRVHEIVKSSPFDSYILKINSITFLAS